MLCVVQGVGQFVSRLSLDSCRLGVCAENGTSLTCFRR
jgi:hypothetical protein